MGVPLTERVYSFTFVVRRNSLETMNELKSSSQRPTDPPRKKLAMELRCFATAFLVGLVSCLTGVGKYRCSSTIICLF